MGQRKDTNSRAASSTDSHAPETGDAPTTGAARGHSDEQRFEGVLVIDDPDTFVDSLDFESQIALAYFLAKEEQRKKKKARRFMSSFARKWRRRRLRRQ